MKKNNIIYWITTGIVSLMMAFSAFTYFTNPQAVEGFKHLGFPDYFRIELGIAKIAAAIALLIPQIPNKIKEWAYAGLGITFISASIAHSNSGDPVSNVITPFVILGLLIISYIYKEKITANK